MVSNLWCNAWGDQCIVTGFATRSFKSRSGSFDLNRDSKSVQVERNSLLDSSISREPDDTYKATPSWQPMQKLVARQHQRRRTCQWRWRRRCVGQCVAAAPSLAQAAVPSSEATRAARSRIALLSGEGKGWRIVGRCGWGERGTVSNLIRASVCGLLAVKPLVFLSSLLFFNKDFLCMCDPFSGRRKYRK